MISGLQSTDALSLTPYALPLVSRLSAAKGMPRQTSDSWVVERQGDEGLACEGRKPIAERLLREAG